MTVVAAALAIAACSTVTEPHGPPAELKALPRDLTSAELRLIDASNSFSFALWNKVSGAQRDKNVFISPLSASFSLGMTLNGAANQTFDQMRTALSVGSVSQQDVNAGYKSFTALLMSLDPPDEIMVRSTVGAAYLARRTGVRMVEVLEWVNRAIEVAERLGREDDLLALRMARSGVSYAAGRDFD